MPESLQEVVVSSNGPVEGQPFTPEALEQLRAILRGRENRFLNVATAVASSVGAECVLRDHVLIAEAITSGTVLNGAELSGTPHGMLVRYLGAIGGAALSLALSMLTNLLSGTAATGFRILLTVGAAVVGTMALTIHALLGPATARKIVGTRHATSKLANPATSE